MSFFDLALILIAKKFYLDPELKCCSLVGTHVRVSKVMSLHNVYNSSFLTRRKDQVTSLDSTHLYVNKATHCDLNTLSDHQAQIGLCVYNPGCLALHT